MINKLIRHLETTWVGHFYLQSTTLMVTIFSFSFFIFFYWGSNRVSQIINLWGNTNKIIVYLNESDLNLQSKIKEKIQLIKGIDKVTILSQAENYQEFKGQISQFASSMSWDEELLELMPISLDITLQSQLNQDEIFLISENIKSISGVDEILNGHNWILKYKLIFEKIEILVGTLALVFVITSVLIFMNLMKTSVESRRKEIEIYEMIGESSWGIQWPYLIEGGLLAFISSVFGILIAYAASTFILIEINGIVFLKKISNQLTFLSWHQIMVLIVLLTGLGVLSAYLTLFNVNSYEPKKF